MIRTNRHHLAVAAYTHPGLSGRINEDRFAVASFENAAGKPVVFAVVADGIGGHSAGEVAAELAVETVMREVAHSSGSAPLETMESAIHTASQAIAENSARNTHQLGMGSTCACVWVEGRRLYTAYVGDSRIYLLRGGQLRLTSVDHTWLQEAIERGVITAEQRHGHPNAHVLRRHLGSIELPKVDSRLRLTSEDDEEAALRNQGLELGQGDAVLICSDGLSDMVPDDEIQRLLTRGSGVRSAAEALVRRAKEHGGVDNITVVLIGMSRPLVVLKSMRGLLKRVWNF